MSIVCPVIFVPKVRDFFFKLVLFTTLNSSQTAGLLLLCDHRIFFVIGPMVTTAAYGLSNLGIHTSTKTHLKTAHQKSQNTSPTETPTNRSMATSTMKVQVPVLRGEGWTPLFLVEKVGLRAESRRRGYPDTSLCLHSHS